MTSLPHTSTELQSGLNSLREEEAVYREQVNILYQYPRVSLLSNLMIAPVFAIMAWGNGHSHSVLIWLAAIYLLAGIRYWSAHKFKQLPLVKCDIRQWEKYFGVGIMLLAIFWGSTSLWLNEQSSHTQHIFQIITLTGLISASVAHLSARPYTFYIFLLLSMFIYLYRYITLDTPYHWTITGLLGFYILIMIPISFHIHSVISESLKLRYENIKLLQSFEEANTYNHKANQALFEVMQKNKLKELELEKSETFLKSILVTANDGIITSDSHGTIMAVNHAILRDFGYNEKELIGNSINLIMAEDMGRKHDQYIRQYLNSDAPILKGRMLDVMGKRKDGSLFPMEITVSETHVDDKTFFTGIIRDITSRKEYEKILTKMMEELSQAKRDLEHANSLLHLQNTELTKLSEHDALTGLANRRFLIKTLKQEWLRHQRTHRPISIVLLDIDFFKHYNDTYGHQAGDGCLREIADTLAKSITRPADFIARYGGEEFIAVLPETDLSGATHIAEKMRHSIEQLQIVHDKSRISEHITASGGVASIVPGRDDTFEDLISYADEALYEAKHSGRNRIRVH